jgi:hypothetical protein
VWKCAKCRSSTGLPPPPSNGYGPYGILAVCRINLWPAVRVELGQEGWLKQTVAKVRGPIMAGDQGSRGGRQCSACSAHCKIGDEHETWTKKKRLSLCTVQTCERNCTVKSTRGTTWVGGCTVARQANRSNPVPLWVCVSPGRELLTSWLTHWTSETVWKCEKCRSSTASHLDTVVDYLQTSPVDRQ